MDWKPLDPGEEWLLGRDCPLVTPFICLAAWSVLGQIYPSWTSHLWGLELGKGAMLHVLRVTSTSVGWLQCFGVLSPFILATW